METPKGTREPAVKAAKPKANTTTKAILPMTQKKQDEPAKKEARQGAAGSRNPG